MGSSNNNGELSGKAINEKKIVFILASHTAFIIVKTITSSLFGRYELGAHLAFDEGYKQYLKMKGEIVLAPMLLFYMCLCVLTMARASKTKERKYMVQAKPIHKELTNSPKNKNPSILHYVSSLNAEKVSLKQKKSQEVRKLYNDALTMSARGGYMHDAALAQEQFADYLLNTVGDFY
eukprot:15366267-Ditylum_brightwellii.AAC.2